MGRKTWPGGQEEVSALVLYYFLLCLIPGSRHTARAMDLWKDLPVTRAQGLCQQGQIPESEFVEAMTDKQVWPIYEPCSVPATHSTWAKQDQNNHV